MIKKHRIALDSAGGQWSRLISRAMKERQPCAFVAVESKLKKNEGGADNKIIPRSPPGSPRLFPTTWPATETHQLRSQRRAPVPGKGQGCSRDPRSLVLHGESADLAACARTHVVAFACVHVAIRRWVVVARNFLKRCGVPADAVFALRLRRFSRERDSEAANALPPAFKRKRMFATNGKGLNTNVQLATWGVCAVLVLVFDVIFGPSAPQKVHDYFTPSAPCVCFKPLYCKELPAALRARAKESKPYILKEELVKVVQWKLWIGAMRPSLLKYANEQAAAKV